MLLGQTKGAGGHTGPPLHTFSILRRGGYQPPVSPRHREAPERIGSAPGLW